jgi:hypothetical protein
MGGAAGEGAGTTFGISCGLVGFAALGLGAALLLARRHPEAQRTPLQPSGQLAQPENAVE